MRWARFRSNDGRTGFGTFDGEHIAEHAGDLFSAPQATGRTLSRGTFTLQSPCAPSKIVALWNNFNALAMKLGKPAPTHPLFLIKPGTSVVGPGEQIRRPTGYTGKIAYEGELGIVIGRLCKDLPPKEAGGHIFGYTCVNDVTASDILNENADFAQWCRSKGYDTFGCLGPAIATGLDWSRLRVITRVDGTERQNYPLSDMIIPPEELVSRISHDMTLLPGDVIACGTSVGVGSIKDGCAVEVEIDGIGSLMNVLSQSSQ
ncbi:MAG TPA: fumarylacetoacetate hydrolase family protein [Steroidobacteraceae bacterium]|jgi:2-keto-4-pentenoate hydratase/2-oxohepta-3-ene-1,7-dioic acid hydratase in catechol pathway|nr:fumarylacetoacetate hydrolase family protein [Steroidobacteraceae bacterium]